MCTCVHKYMYVFIYIYIYIYIHLLIWNESANRGSSILLHNVSWQVTTNLQIKQMIACKNLWITQDKTSGPKGKFLSQTTAKQSACAGIYIYIYISINKTKTSFLLQKRAITTFLSRKFMITRLSIAFEDFLGSSIASQVMPPCNSRQ